MSGLEALRLLRAEKWGEKIPVIMLTAQADVENLSEAVTTGGTNMEYLTKTDWRLSDVVNKVQDKLAQVEAKEKAEAATKATEEPGS